MGSNCAIALSDGLRHCNNLHTLDISHNNIGSEGALSDGLRHCSNLHTLVISYNNIGDKGVSALRDSLKQCSILRINPQRK